MRTIACIAALFVWIDGSSQAMAIAPEDGGRGNGVEEMVKVTPPEGILKQLFCADVGVDPACSDAVPRLIRLLRSPDRDTRLGAMFALGEFHQEAESAIPLLARCLGQDQGLGEAAAQALGQISTQSNEALPILLKAANSQDAPLRARAALGLGFVRHNPDVVLPALLRCLRDSDTSVQVNAARGLYNLHHTTTGRVLPRLERALARSSGMLKVELSRTVGILQILAHKRLEVVPNLIQGLKDKDPCVRSRAAQVLGNLSGYYVVGIRDFPHAAEAVDALVEALGDRDENVRRSALDALSYTRRISDRGVRVLIDVLKDPDPDIRTLAAGVLERNGPKAKGAVPALKEVARNDPDEMVRVQSASALWEIEHRPEWANLIAQHLLKCVDPYVRYCAAFSMRNMESQKGIVVPALKQALRDSDELVREIAKSTLEQLESFP